MHKILLVYIFLFGYVSNEIATQQAYFVDGYHGGIYGHYPMWQTQFMVDKLALHSEWSICIEIEPETWDSVQVKEPAAYENFRKIVTDKRIDFTNPTYAQPYCYNISGESIIRQFQYGMKAIHRHFPGVTFTTYSVEEPCFTSALPQLLKSLGFKYAVLKNPDTCWGGYVRAYGGQLVNWIGPDGTSVLTVPRYACEELEDNSTWQTKAWSNSDDYLKACFDYGIENPAGMCFQDAGWKNGPWIGHGDRIKNNSKYTTWTNYIENVSAGKTDDDWRFSQEDVLVNLMWGSQVLQRIAQEVRVSENKIIMAEKMGAMAYLENNYRPAQSQLDEGWRTLMMAQHHDSWIVPYNRLNENRTWAQEITLWTNKTNDVSDDIIKSAAGSYSPAEKSSDGLGYVRVFNTLANKRSEVVRLDLPQDLQGKNIAVYNVQNKEIPSFIETVGNTSQVVFRADVPSFGYATYQLKEKSKNNRSNSPVKSGFSSEYVLENDIYRIVFDSSKGGVIKSLIAKKLGNKEFADRANEFSLGELRGFFYQDNKFYSSTDTPAKIVVVKDNGLEKSVRIEGFIAGHPFTQTITLTTGQKRIDFDLKINWKENVGIGEYEQVNNWQENRRAFHDDRFKLNVLFPVNLNAPKLYKNAPFDVCESKLEDTFFNTWDNIKHNIILNWVDLVEPDGKYGIALLSDHTTSYSYGKDFPLGLTAQYSGKGLWGPDYKITEPLNITYSIVPHKGAWDESQISEESNCWNEPLITEYFPSLSISDKSFIEIQDAAYELSAVYADGEDLIVRLFNAQGDDKNRNISFDFPVRQIQEINLNGEVIENKVVKKTKGKSTVAISMPRFGIKTFRVQKNEDI